MLMPPAIQTKKRVVYRIGLLLGIRALEGFNGLARLGGTCDTIKRPLLGWASTLDKIPIQACSLWVAFLGLV